MRGVKERREEFYRIIEEKRLQRISRRESPPYSHCKNCGEELKGLYCYKCGQYAHDNNQPFWKYLWQYFENVYQLDSKVPITVWNLFRRPGFLTNEFNAGKIQSYMHPLKLNMFILVIFFTVVIFIGGKLVDRKLTQGNIEGYIAEHVLTDSLYLESKDTMVFFMGNRHILEKYPDIFKIEKIFTDKHSLSGPDGLSYKDEQNSSDTILVTLPSTFLRDRVFLKVNSYVPDSLFRIAGVDSTQISKTMSDEDIRMLKKTIEVASSTLDSVKFKKLSDEVNSMTFVQFYKVTPNKKYAQLSSDEVIDRGYIEQFMSLAKNWMPIIFLLTLPFLAWLLRFVYRRQKLNYMSHLVFSLHYCAAMFILLFVVVLLMAFADNVPADIVMWMYMSALFLYFVISSHTVYKGTSWVMSIVKSIIVQILYLVLVTLVMLILTVIFMLMTEAGQAL